MTSQDKQDKQQTENAQMKVIIDLTDTQVTDYMGTATHGEVLEAIKEIFAEECFEATITLEDPSIADTTIFDPDEVEAEEASESNDGEG